MGRSRRRRRDPPGQAKACQSAAKAQEVGERRFCKCLSLLDFLRVSVSICRKNTITRPRRPASFPRAFRCQPLRTRQDFTVAREDTRRLCVFGRAAPALDSCGRRGRSFRTPCSPPRRLRGLAAHGHPVQGHRSCVSGGAGVGGFLVLSGTHRSVGPSTVTTEHDARPNLARRPVSPGRACLGRTTHPGHPLWEGNLAFRYRPLRQGRTTVSGHRCVNKAPRAGTPGIQRALELRCLEWMPTTQAALCACDEP